MNIYPQKHILFDRDQPNSSLSLHDLEKGPVILNISASDALLTSLCGDYDLLEFTSLQATCEARLWRKDGFIIEGTIHAEYTQKCVVSLKPVPQIMKTEFTQKFSPIASHMVDKEIEIDPLQEDDIEDLENGKIDLTAFIFEVFALELDLYPRLTEAKIDNNYSQKIELDDTIKPASPFAVLKGLKEQE